MFHVVKGEVVPSREGLSGRLEFSFSLKNLNNQRYVLLDARAAVYLRHQNGVRLYVDQAFLYQSNSYSETQRGGELFLRLFMPVSHANAVLIEEVRGTNKITFAVELVVLALPLDGPSSTNVPVRCEAIHELRIEKSQWVEEFLPTFGMDDYELWEVRFARMASPTSLKSETEHLRKALHEYNNGEYANCFQNCRKAIESLSKRRTELALDGVVGSEEWKRASGYLSIALHVDDDLPKTIPRGEAEFALSLTRAFIQRVGRALVQRGTPPPSGFISSASAN